MSRNEHTGRANEVLSRKRRSLLPVLTLLALGVAALLPASRWLIVAQWRTQLAPESGGYEDERVAQVAAQHPNDIPMQMAQAVSWPNARDEAAPHLEREPASVLKSRRLRELTARFPDSPSLYANVLRFMTLGEVLLHRDDEVTLSPPSSTPLAANTPRPVYSPAEPQNLADFDAAAAQGERLDPANAYFPLMRAVGLYAARRDEEARAALHRAAQKTVYNEYYQDECDGEWRLYEAVTGRHDPIVRMLQEAAILFPHYAQIRAMTRLAVSQAAAAESAGHPAEGLEIRRDIRRVGGRMRAQSRPLIGSLVGIACANISTLRPGGAPPQPAYEDHDEEHRQAYRDARIRRYTDYLRGLGATDEARASRSEYEAGNVVKAVVNRSMDSDEVWDVPAALRVLRWQFTSVAILANALGLLVLSAAAWLAARAKAKNNRGAARFLFGTMVCLALLLWQRGVTTNFLSGWNAFNALLGEANDAGATLRSLLALSLSLAVPFLLVATLAAISLYFGVAVGTGVGRGLRAVALPLACLLLLLHVGLLVPNLREQARLHHILDRTLEGEGAHRAALLGQAWPDAVR